MVRCPVPRQKKHRDYQNTYPSCTQVLGIIRNPILEFWFKKNTLEFITQESNKGKLIGRQIHDSIQNFVETGTSKVETEYELEVSNALKSFMKFRSEHKDINFIWAEKPLVSEKYGFNGTIDCFSEGLILDWKSAKCGTNDVPDIFDSYKTQISAYVYLYNECFNAKIEDALIVSIAKDKIAYNTYRLDATEIYNQFNEVFLPALKIYNYTHRKV